MPSAAAIRPAAVNRSASTPGDCSASSTASWWCSLGTTRTCVGACGLMSRKATVVSVSATTVAGISPATIRQNRQSGWVSDEVMRAG